MIDDGKGGKVDRGVVWYNWGGGRGEVEDGMGWRMMSGGWIGCGWEGRCCAGVLGYGDVDGFSKRGEVLS